MKARGVGLLSRLRMISNIVYSQRHGQQQCGTWSLPVHLCTLKLKNKVNIKRYESPTVCDKTPSCLSMINTPSDRYRRRHTSQFVFPRSKQGSG